MKIKKSLKNKLNFFENFILEIIFPTQCVGCGKQGILLCEKCFKSIELLNLQKCPNCEKSITESGKVCLECRKTDYPIKNLLLATDYKDPLISKLIHLFKYKFISDIHSSLGELLLQSFLKHKIEIPEVIIPIPLHPFRLRWRGFNQSELLAQYLGKNLTPGVEISVLEKAIERTRYSPPQMKIKKYSERKKNVAGIFKANQIFKKEISGKKILLVDDICTTGSTLVECAKALQDFNPRSISAIVIARQS